MTKWEYCVLVGAYGRPQTSYPGLYRMTPNGKQPMENFKNRPKDVDEDQVVAQMIFQLGEDGWELVFGQHMGDSSLPSPADYMWFKRPKS